MSGPVSAAHRLGQHRYLLPWFRRGPAEEAWLREQRREYAAAGRGSCEAFRTDTPRVEALVPAVRRAAREQPRLPHVRVMLTADGRWNGCGYDPDLAEGIVPVDMIEVGRSWCSVVPTISARHRLTPPEPEVPHAALHARLLPAVGEDFLRSVAALTFGMVGAGSIGAALARGLAMLGARRLILFDDDVITGPSTVGKGSVFAFHDVGRPKVEVVAEHLHQLRGCQVIPVPHAITEAAAWPYLLHADILCAAVDTQHGLAAPGRLANAYLLPLVTAGARIIGGRAQETRPALAGDVSLIVPGHGCARCVLGLEDERVAGDFRHWTGRRRGAPGVAEDRPVASSPTFNESIAGLAAEKLMAYLRGDTFESHVERVEMRDGKLSVHRRWVWRGCGLCRERLDSELGAGHLWTARGAG